MRVEGARERNAMTFRGAYFFPVSRKFDFLWFRAMVGGYASHRRGSE